MPHLLYKTNNNKNEINQLIKSCLFKHCGQTEANVVQFRLLSNLITYVDFLKKYKQSSLVLIRHRHVHQITNQTLLNKQGNYCKTYLYFTISDNLIDFILCERTAANILNLTYEGKSNLL